MESAERDIVDKLLGTTRSVRRKLDLERPVAPELIEECIDLAVQAPTGARREDWRFLVVSAPEKKRALRDLYLHAFESFIKTAAERAREEAVEWSEPGPGYRELAVGLDRFPVLIVVCAEGRPDPQRQVAFYGSILPAAWSLMLALRSRGLGTTWTSLHLAYADEAAQLLGIPDNATQTVLLPVAYMDGAVLRRAARKSAREVTFWNAWGTLR